MIDTIIIIPGWVFNIPTCVGRWQLSWFIYYTPVLPILVFTKSFFSNFFFLFISDKASMSVLYAFFMMLTMASATSLQDCEADMTGFELVTGYVFTAPDDLLDSIPGTLMLTDCLEACNANDTCESVNYETGLCVMFSSNADAYPGKS